MNSFDGLNCPVFDPIATNVCLPLGDQTWCMKAFDGSHGYGVIGLSFGIEVSHTIATCMACHCSARSVTFGASWWRRSSKSPWSSMTAGNAKNWAICNWPHGVFKQIHHMSGCDPELNISNNTSSGRKKGAPRQCQKAKPRLITLTCSLEASFRPTDRHPSPRQRDSVGAATADHPWQDQIRSSWNPTVVYWCILCFFVPSCFLRF